MVICARLSTWNTPTESAWHSISYTSGSSAGTVASVHCSPFKRCDQVEGAADAGQHAERQHVDLEHAELVEIVLVPFDDGAVRHRRVLDRHHFLERPARDDEAADMLRQVARKAQELVREVERQAQVRLGRIEAHLAHVALGDAVRAPAPHRAGERARHILATGPRPCRPRGSRFSSGSRSRWRRARRGRGRISRRCTGSPPRAARARNRRRCRAARCARR